MRKLIASLLLLTCLSANSFEVKGIALSADASKVDFSGCTATSNVDRGMPGYICQTTYARAPAEIKIGIFGGKVAILVVAAENALFKPIKDEFVQSYGSPYKDPQFESYTWIRGDRMITMAEHLNLRRYIVRMADIQLVNRFTAPRDNSIKSDM